MVFITDSGQELFLAPLGIIPYGDRPGSLLVSGHGLFVGQPCTSNFYMGVYSPAQNRVTFWLATEQERQLLFALHDRDLLSAADLQSLLAGEESAADVWVDIESAYQRAGELDKQGRPRWNKRSVTAAMHALEGAYKRRQRSGQRPLFRIRYRRRYLEVELVGVVAFLDSGGKVSYIGSKSHQFFQEWLCDLQRARRAKNPDRKAKTA